MFIVREEAKREFFPSLVSINQTRLKDTISSNVPDMKAYQKGREVILVFEMDGSQTKSTVFEYTNGTRLYLARTAEIAREETS
jgi:hypothetical protein